MHVFRILLYSLFVQVALLATLAHAQNLNSTKCEALAKKSDTAIDAVHLDIEQVGDRRIAVNWEVGKANWPEEANVYLMIVSIEAVRFEGGGLIPFTPGSEGPMGIEFAEKWMRAATPISMLKGPKSAKYFIEVSKEGRFGISAAFIEKSKCGERQIGETKRYVFDLKAGQLSVFAQDLYDYTLPKEVIISNNNKYRLHIYEDHFQVFDILSNEKILDERGYCPDFSPTSRFIGSLDGLVEGSCVFYTEGETQPKFQIHDIIFGSFVTKMHPPVIWRNGDAVVSSIPKWWKRLQGESENVSLLLYERENNGKTRPFKIPLASDEYSGMPVFDPARGLFLNDEKSYDMVSRQMLVTGAVKTSKYPSKWSDYQLSHWRYLNGSVGQVLPTETGSMTFEEVYSEIPFSNPSTEYSPESARANFVAHKKLETDEKWKLASLTTGDSRWIADAQTRAEFTAEQQKTALEQQIEAAAEITGTNFLPSKSPSYHYDQFGLMWDVDKLELPDDEKGDLFERLKVDNFRDSGILDIPRFDEYQNRTIDCWPQGEMIRENISGIWRYDLSDKRIWVIHTSCMGIGTVGGNSVALVDIFVERDGSFKRYKIAELTTLDESNDASIASSEETTGGPERGMLPTPLMMLSGKDFEGVPNTEALELGQNSIWVDYFDEGTMTLIIGEKLYFIDLDNEILYTPVNLNQEVEEPIILLDKNSETIIYFSSSDRFNGYSIKTGLNKITGIFIDGETILYTPEGYFASTKEGSQFIQYRFEGRDTVYSLDKLASKLNKPEIVRNLLRKPEYDVPVPDVNPPPSISASIQKAGDAPNSLQGNTDKITLEIFGSAFEGETLKKVSIFVDGRQIDEREMDQREVNYSSEFTVPPGSNWITIIAKDSQGFESAEAQIKLESNNKTDKNLFVISSGNDAYEDVLLPDLNYSESDSNNFLNAVNKIESKYYKNIFTYDSIDGSNDLLSDIKNLLNNIIINIGKSDTLIINLSGHGIKDSENNFYLADADTDVSKLKDTSTSWRDLLEEISKIDARIFVFLDACHSGIVAGATNDQLASEVSYRSALPIVVLAASKGRQYSLETSRLGGGVFTSFLNETLLNGREKYDVNNDGILELGELYPTLKRRIYSFTKGRQTPWVAVNGMRGHIPLF